VRILSARGHELHGAQVAKIDMTLDKLGAGAGDDPARHRLRLGFGDEARHREVRVYVVGVTLSRNQYAYCQQVLGTVDSSRSRRVLLSDWADFTEPVDRIVIIEAPEHFAALTEALQAHQDRGAEIQSEEMCERYMKFLTGSPMRSGWAISTATS
jgi:cyclopropane fatty-acyl-phospholipid synthase-like methyltransferase